jgi:hypothetical protein
MTDTTNPTETLATDLAKLKTDEARVADDKNAVKVDAAEVVAEKPAEGATGAVGPGPDPTGATGATGPAGAVGPGLNDPTCSTGATGAATVAKKPAVLREDGPTLAEWIAAGYVAANYPPQGYAAKSATAKPKRPPHPSTLPPGQRPAPQGS